MRLKHGIGIVLFTISLYILWTIREILLLVFAAVIFATAINRLVRTLQRFHVQRGMAIALAITLLLVSLGGLFAIVIPSFAAQFQQLVALVPVGLERVRSWSVWLQNLIPGQVLDDIRSIEGLLRQLQAIAPRVFNNFFSLFSNSLGISLKTLLVLVLIVMFLADPAAYRHGFVRLFPSFYRRRAETILDQCEIALGGWLTGILFNMTVIAVMSGLGLWILQIPLPLTNAILAGLMTFIPNLGPTLSVIPPVALALLETPWKAVAVLILYIVIQQIESNILTPFVMQKQVSLLPAVTLVSQLVFASFFGFLGLFLALPIVVVAQVWLREAFIEDTMDQWQN